MFSPHTGWSSGESDNWYFKIYKDNLLFSLRFDPIHSKCLIYITVYRKKQNFLFNFSWEKILLIRRESHSYGDTDFDLKKDDWDELETIILNEYTKRKNKKTQKLIDNIPL